MLLRLFLDGINTSLHGEKALLLEHLPVQSREASSTVPVCIYPKPLFRRQFAGFFHLAWHCLGLEVGTLIVKQSGQRRKGVVMWRGTFPAVWTCGEVARKVDDKLDVLQDFPEHENRRKKYSGSTFYRYLLSVEKCTEH